MTRVQRIAYISLPAARLIPLALLNQAYCHDAQFMTESTDESVGFSNETEKPKYVRNDVISPCRQHGNLAENDFHLGSTCNVPEFVRFGRERSGRQL